MCVAVLHLSDVANLYGQIECSLKCYNTLGVLDTNVNFEAGKMERQFRKFMKAMGSLNMVTFTQEVVAAFDVYDDAASDELNRFIL